MYFTYHTNIGGHIFFINIISLLYMTNFTDERSGGFLMRLLSQIKFGSRPCKRGSQQWNCTIAVCRKLCITIYKQRVYRRHITRRACGICEYLNDFDGQQRCLWKIKNKITQCKEALRHKQKHHINSLLLICYKNVKKLYTFLIIPCKPAIDGHL